MAITVDVLYEGLVRRTVDLDDIATLPLADVLGIIIRDAPGRPGLIARLFAHDYYGIYVTADRIRVDRWDEEDKQAQVFLKSNPHDTSRKFQRTNWWPAAGLIFLGRAVRPSEWEVARQRFEEMSDE